MRTLHLTDFNEADRADYMVVVAWMVGAHGPVSSEDIMAIRELCMRFVLGPESRGRVMAASSAPPVDIDQIVSHLAESPLKYSLIVDLCSMAYHHGTPDEQEEAAIKHVADELGVSDAQVSVLHELAHVLSPATKTPQAGVEAALKAVQEAGIPTGAVALSATLMGLEGDDHKEAKDTLNKQKTSL